MLLKNALVYRNATRSFESADIRIENGIIAELGDIKDEGTAIDMQGKAIVPGLIDVHTHGRAG